MAKVKIDDGLWERVKAAAAAAGYSSPEEFAIYAIEQALAAREGAEGADEEEVRKRLQGLGYIS
jgi:hypothetical protein